MIEHVSASSIAELHKNCILQWKALGVQHQHQGFYQLVEENHAFNYQLWHTEDKARRDDMGFEFVYNAKRDIDKFNQARNNRMEAMDEWLFKLLQPAAPDLCPVNSESPGMIIDRLSILALKYYHMDLQTKRSDVAEAHQQTCLQKRNTLQIQLNQLVFCLEDLLQAVALKQRTFRVYHQFKMYNDPKLNPELYEH